MTGQMNSQNNEPPIDHGSHWMATLFAIWLNPRDIAMRSKKQRLAALGSGSGGFDDIADVIYQRCR